MSIYATLWEIKVPRRHEADDEWVRVYAQGVPAHIGHPSHYPNGDPYADFLPPAVENYDSERDDGRLYRAVIILQEGRDHKQLQRYVDPILVLTGEEYARLSFQELFDRICKAMGWDDYICSVRWTKEGMKKIICNKKDFPGKSPLGIIREMRER